MIRIPQAITLAVSLVLLSVAFSPCLSEDQLASNNRGILNGPLTQGGHKAVGEGDCASLKLAIEHLIATYGDKYPNGKAYLKRLKEINSETSAEFLPLKREALLANPLLQFDLLMVQSKKGQRYTRNWQTRTDSEPARRTLSEQDLDLLGDDELNKVLRQMYLSERTMEKRKKEISRTATYRKEKNKQKRGEMLSNDPKYKKAQTAWNKSDKVKSQILENLPGYKTLQDRINRRETIPNYTDALVVMSPISEGTITTIYQPEPGKFIGDVDLHWNADRLLFSSHVGPNELTEVPNVQPGKGYAVYEMRIDPNTKKMLGKPRRVSPDMGGDVDNYDACYLPNGKIIFASTAAYEGVPCVGGRSSVANLYTMNNDGTNVRRLTFDQDASWHPSVMENGRVMYVRWEYTDSAHYFSRVLMTMTPDGNDQKAFYGSNSYWPNSMFFPRQVPGHSNMFVATITGHHSNSKGGALCLFDASKGRHEADGALQLITGRGKKVEPLVIDNLATAYDPMFYEPYPLSDKYFLAMARGSIYLVDAFDNMLCLMKADDDGTYHEPILLRKTPTPPVLPDRVDPTKKDASVLINDIYAGPGLAGVPRGTVKGMRVYRYEYGPRLKGGHYSMGIEAGWDAKQVLGTVPVEDDGSVNFSVPANTPFSMQPLDESGQALQLMRSWTVAMPGEQLGCIGCHESQNMPPVARLAKAMLRAPSKIKPFHGPTRGMGFVQEIQPVLNRYCIGCHDGTNDIDAKGRDKQGRYTIADRIIGTGPNTGKNFRDCGIPNFTLSKPELGVAIHAMLHPYVRRNGPEGDYHMLTPLEFHSSTSELVQMLQKGHHNVKMDQEAWDRIFTWIDLNAPYSGSWTESKANPEILARRMELRKLYANVDYNPEAIVPTAYAEKAKQFVMPRPREVNVVPAKPSQVNKIAQHKLKFDLGDGITMELAKIPSGSFSMGSNNETPMEQPVGRVKIATPFYMGTTEVTLEQYRQFDKEFLNGVYDMHYKDQVKRGYYMNDMQYPVIRVSWQRAMAFCQWLSKKTGKKVSLPTEPQWEWACRSGTETPLWFGDLDTEFSTFANLADITVKEMAVKGTNPKPYANPKTTMDFELKDPRSNDGVLHLAEVGKYEPNAWGLYDMHGNAAEWTRSDYKPYPYKPSNANSVHKKVVRGGSWHDRPFRSTATYRLGYPAWQRVYHTGFRVVVE